MLLVFFITKPADNQHTLLTLMFTLSSGLVRFQKHKMVYLVYVLTKNHLMRMLSESQLVLPITKVATKTTAKPKEIASIDFTRTAPVKTLSCEETLQILLQQSSRGQVAETPVRTISTAICSTMIGLLKPVPATLELVKNPIGEKLAVFITRLLAAIGLRQPLSMTTVVARMRQISMDMLVDSNLLELQEPIQYKIAISFVKKTLIANPSPSQMMELHANFSLTEFALTRK